MAIHYAKGTYKCRVEGQAISKSKDKGTPCVEVVFSVLASADPVNKTEKPVDTSYKRKATVWLTEKTFEKFAKGQLQAIGWDGTTLSALDPSNAGYQDLTGNEFYGYCSHKGEFEEWGISDGKSGGRGPKLNQVDGLSSDLDRLFNLSGNTPKAPVEPIDDSELPF